MCFICWGEWVAFPAVKSQLSQFQTQTIGEVSYPIMGKWLASRDREWGKMSLPEKPVIRYHDFPYQAKSWDRPRRVVTKVE
jgi:hypothetical protein